jgi:hypothetical protein
VRDQIHRRRRAGSALLLLACAWFCPGCDGELGQSFREASRDEFETATNALLDGLVQGVFEVYDPDDSSSAP